MAPNPSDKRNTSSPDPDPCREWRESELGPDGYLCLDCLGNDVIPRSGRIADADEGVCLYCGHKSQGGARSVHAVLEFIYYSLRCEYSPHYHESETDIHMADDPREMVGGSSISTKDLLHELGEHIGDDLLNQLERSISHSWVHSDGPSPQAGERMAKSWRHFADTVRTGPRLLRRDNVSSNSDASSLEDVLHYLDVTTSHLQTELVKNFETGEIVYRARDEAGLTSAEDLGSPPPQQAGPQRMSACGVSAFYAAADAPTAIAEIGADTSNVSVGKWTTTKSMVVFDIGQPVDLPSIFAYTGREKRQYSQFFNSVRPVLTHPADQNLGEANFYLPTQIFAEHLRYYLITRHPQRVDAVRYPSAKSDDGLNWCFFGRPDQKGGGMEFLGLVDI